LGDSELSGTAQLLGTVNNRRGRWNPFLPENNMEKAGARYSKQLELRAQGGRHGDGVYAFRFVTNHNLRQTYKADHQDTDDQGKPQLVSGEQSHQAQNVIIKVAQDGQYRFDFDPAANTFAVSPAPEFLTSIESVQLNGFVWDDEDDFQKFDETRGAHEMTPNGDWWELTVSLKTDGGMTGRDDGVYQFLFSANRNEDWGFAGFNAGGGQRLAGGTGFGSSGGQSRHSAITIKVVQNGDYTIRIHPREYLWEVRPSGGAPPVEYLNDLQSFQLLGKDGQFDPTREETMMQPAGGHRWSKTVELEPGVCGMNFAINRELFLDTMALGAWLDSSHETRLVGRAWHGKPNEPNVFFEVKEKGQVKFTYDADTDEFAIEPLGGAVIEAKATIDTLQIVGDPVGNWEPTDPANNMQRIGESLFTKTIRLEGGKNYAYKITANNWPWKWTFADYELDGYGDDYGGLNPDPANSRLEDLKRYGHLTTHGNPEPLQVQADETADYKFTVNLESGAYAVHRQASNP
jgi:hypothetical protein